MNALAAVPPVVGSFLIIYGTILQGSPGMMFFAIGLATLLIVPVTALFCRHRMRHGLGISYGTAAAGAYAAALLTFCVTLIRVARFERWTPEYWACLFIGYVLCGLGYALPALCVVHYYQKRAQVKSHEAQQSACT